MAECQYPDLTDEQNFPNLLQGIDDLQSRASDIGIKRKNKQSCIYQEECDKSKKDTNEDEALKIIKQTTEVARMAMILIINGLKHHASYASHKSKCFNSLSSAIAYLRQQDDSYKVPQHLLLEWERNMILMDLFITNEGLYCSKTIAQDMFDICMETLDWLRSFSNNNK